MRPHVLEDDNWESPSQDRRESCDKPLAPSPPSPKSPEMFKCVAPVKVPFCTGCPLASGLVTLRQTSHMLLLFVSYCRTDALHRSELSLGGSQKILQRLPSQYGQQNMTMTTENHLFVMLLMALLLVVTP